MRTSEAIDQISAALVMFQAAITPPKKGRTANAEKFSYNYADLADVMDAIRQPMSAAGLALTQVFDGEGQAARLITRLVHSSGQWLESSYPLSSGKTPQQFGSEVTYARRYSACGILGIAAEDDDDGAGATGKPPANAAAPAPARREPRPVSKEASNFVDGVTRPKTAEPDEPGSHDGPEVYQGPVIQVTAKSGETKGKKWTFHTVEGADRFTARTFDQKIADLATECMTHKASVRIGYEAGPKGNKILDMVPIS